MTGKLLKIKVEPEDENLRIVTGDDKTEFNPSVQNSDNLLSESSTSSDRHLYFNKLLEENENLKNENVELKGKINHQEKFMANLKEQISCYEKNITKTNLVIHHLKTKNDVYKRENSNLKLQVKMLQVKVLQLNEDTDLEKEPKADIDDLKKTFKNLREQLDKILQK